MKNHTRTYSRIFRHPKKYTYHRLCRLLFSSLLLLILPSIAAALEGQQEDVDASIQISPRVEQAGPDTPKNIPSKGGATIQSKAVTQAPLQLLGETINPGVKKRLSWTLGHTFEGIPVSAPILVVNGRHPGPTLCLTAAVHGDEINGIAMVHRTFSALKSSQLNGAVIGVPIVNMHGYRRSSRYLPDRRDLNRYFPGSPEGSSAARIAHSFFQQVITHCDALVDLHTGSFHRTNLPQVRADLNHPATLELAYSFGGVAVVHSEGITGTLRRAAMDRGIPSITLEAGEPKRLQLQKVHQGLKGIRNLMRKLAMVDEGEARSIPEAVFHQTQWIRTHQAGILLSEVSLGDPIKAGQQLGIITNPITNQQTPIISPYDGQLLGMALNQVTIPGYAAYHIGIKADKPGFIEESPEHVAAKTEMLDYSDGEE
ncbi:succinylglutamate desuccinylase/aspartoacylase family protein [Nitrosococcus watsonii]|uniref:Succinylglutamate desuccinylase/aspartoacylase n=1 Tax=Nitrosococcus watsoni (strain C-113) TaxID=105559 RepID=D8K8R8_NITWC|nr:succinylglutamate desuccinylase/aspartoacylase family protein [Nitrosococcus watsonii]ADJ27128.1 Succinylglutamate desuccinylase/aspartoacylase [Nitrosococcus watsonii C-113]